MRKKKPETTLVGRDSVVDEVAARLLPGECFYLYGPPGVGKSAIAHAAVCRTGPSPLSPRS